MRLRQDKFHISWHIVRHHFIKCLKIYDGRRNCFISMVECCSKVIINCVCRMDLLTAFQRLMASLNSRSLQFARVHKVWTQWIYLLSSASLNMRTMLRCKLWRQSFLECIGARFGVAKISFTSKMSFFVNPMTLLCGLSRILLTIFFKYVLEFSQTCLKIFYFLALFHGKY